MKKLKKHINEALKYLENPDQLSAFVAHHLAARQFLDPETGIQSPRTTKMLRKGPISNAGGSPSRRR